MNIKITKEDKKISEIVRRRAMGRCEWCKKWKGWKGLQASHFKGRANKQVRHDPDNISAVCFTCHNFLGANPDTHTAWFKKRLGEEAYNKLILRANGTKKPDMKLLNIWLDRELANVREQEDECTMPIDINLGDPKWMDEQHKLFTSTHPKGMTFGEWLQLKSEGLIDEWGQRKDTKKV